MACHTVTLPAISEKNFPARVRSDLCLRTRGCEPRRLEITMKLSSLLPPQSNHRATPAAGVPPAVSPGRFFGARTPTLPWLRLAFAGLLALATTTQVQAQSGNSLIEAQDLGALESPRLLTGHVNGNDPQDYFRFEITDSVRVVNLLIPESTLDGYVDLVLAQDRNENFVIEDDEILDDSRGHSRASAASQLWLNPGKYYARVQAVSGYETGYQLTLSQSPRPDSGGALDDSIALAYQRPALKPGIPVKDFIGRSDEIDIYPFEVTNEVHEVRLVIPQSSLAGYLRLYLVQDSNNNLLADADEILGPEVGHGRATVTLEAWLNPGRYLVMVEAYPGYQTPYDLTLSLTPKPHSGGSLDNSIAQSLQRAPLTHAQTVSDYVGFKDPSDVYRFEVGGSVTKIEAVLPKASLNGYATLEVIRDDNQNGIIEDSEILDDSTGHSNTDARIETWLDPGQYFVRVSAYPGYAPNYALTLSTAARPNSLGNRDNDPAAPGYLGHITSPKTIDDFVGAADLQDFFRFDVTGPSRKVTAQLPAEHLQGYAYLRLFADANQDGILEELDDATGHSRANATIEKVLGSGRYFLQVERHSGYNTPYRLILTRTFTGEVPPFVILTPTPQTIVAGKPATFGVQGDGSGTLQYQWYLDGVPVPGATSESVTLTDRIVEVRDYTVSVRISNALGGVTTESVRLQVTPADVELGIARAVLLSWPLAGTDGYLVQGAPTASGPWTFLTSRAVIVNGNRREFIVDNPASFGAFRLAKP